MVAVALAGIRAARENSRFGDLPIDNGLLVLSTVRFD